eukprot:TRINITY_DN18878_c0_g1_i2.p3 TRINITY_DN18878_c0_g1~~TRINITY_DN18878_c0_g1_i2.p3  ORF type:complete len:169 (+),score=26.14 TRINITY_DN18878_c0_g1_i2:162-668(+)
MLGLGIHVQSAIARTLSAKEVLARMEGEQTPRMAEMYVLPMQDVTNALGQLVTLWQHNERDTTFFEISWERKAQWWRNRLHHVKKAYTPFSCPHLEDTVRGTPQTLFEARGGLECSQVVQPDFATATSATTPIVEECAFSVKSFSFGEERRKKPKRKRAHVIYHSARS